MSTNRQSSSALLMAILPAAVIFVGYATWMMLSPSKEKQQVTALQGQVEQLKSQQIPEAQLRTMTMQVADTEAKLSAKRAELNQLHTQATGLLHGSLTSAEQIRTERRVNQLFHDFGLKLVSQSPIDDRQLRLLKSLETATSELDKKLASISTFQESDDKTKGAKSKLPSTVVPKAVIEQMRNARNSRRSEPTTILSELKLVGDYLSMQRGLQEIATCCPDVVVTSVSFETPKVNTANPSPLIWSVKYQLRPAMETPALEQEDVIATGAALKTSQPIRRHAVARASSVALTARHAQSKSAEHVPIYVFPASAKHQVNRPISNAPAEQGD